MIKSMSHTCLGHKTFEELSACGVVFLQEPTQRPYGIEAVFREDSGNGFNLTQRVDGAS